MTPYDPYPGDLRSLAARALDRLRGHLRRAAPSLAAPTLAWMRDLAGSRSPERYFLHPDAFPMLLLPWWLEETIHGTPNLEFQRDVVASTIAGYYVVRMIDDLMDRERPPDLDVLPALIHFQVAFQRPYQRWFAADHPFWTAFEGETSASAEMAARDAGLEEIDRELFDAISSRKTIGVRIPLAAVCHRYGRTDLLAAWYELVELFGRWHQMRNDMLGWRRDLDHGRATYFLSEGISQAGASTGVPAWVLGDGLTWGYGELDAWMDELTAAARTLGSPPLERYLDERARAAAAERDGMLRDIATVGRLLRA